MTEGHISNLKCKACSREFPTFVFVADTDMATSGMMSITVVSSHNIILLCQRTPVSDAQCEASVASRIGEECKAVPLLRSADRHIPSDDFQEFMRNYVPPELFYRCIHCGGEATPVSEQTKEEFTQKHKITVLED